MFFLFQIAIFNMGWSNDVVANTQTVDVKINVNEKNIPIKIASQSPRYFIIAPSGSAPVIERMLILLKCPNQTVTSLDELPDSVPEGLVSLIIYEGNLDNIGNMDILWQYIEQGVSVFFTKILDTSAENYQRYYGRFGIMRDSGRYQQAGIDFLNKLLVSGIFFNADIKTPANKVDLDGTCLVYAVGYDENIKEYKDRNPMIWRTFHDNAYMYFYNCDIIDDFAYIGVFAGIISMDKDVFVYPIANTGVVMLDAMPYFSTVNEENMERLYNRDIIQLQRDVVWSDLISVTKGLDIKYTIYPMVGEKQEELEKKLLESFGKAVAVNRFEFGIYPSKMFAGTFPSYKLTSALRYTSPEMKNKVTFDCSDFGYDSGGTLRIPIATRVVQTDKNMSADQKERAHSNNKFKGFSIASALGYFAQYSDLTDIFGNRGAEENWSQYKLDFIQCLYPIAATFDYIKSETVSSAMNKLNVYLNCVPEISIYENEIVITGQEIGDITYIIRTMRKVDYWENCTLRKLSKEYSVVTVGSTNAIIRTEREDKKQ